MTAAARMRRRRRRRLVAPLLLLGAAGLLVLGHAARGAGEEPAPAASAQSWLGVIDHGGTLIDASPDEAPGEVWSLGDDRVLRYTDADGWTAMPAPVDADGQPMEHLAGAGGPLAGRATRDGAVALLADDQLIVRDPGGRFHAAPSPAIAPVAPPSTTAPPTTGVPGSTTAPASTTDPGSTTVPGSTTAPASTTAPPATATAPLAPGERLYADNAPLLAPLEQDGHAGAFVVPTAGDDRARDAVLRFDGSAWTREPICLGTAPACDAPRPTFSVVAIDAAGASHAWLLATGTTSDAGVVLLHRVTEDGDPVWRPASLGASPYAQRTPPAGAAAVRVAPRALGQPLVATPHGVWADATITVGAAAPRDATLFYDEDAGAVRATWCDVGGDAGAALCAKPLGSDLADGSGRSFAFDDGTTYGVRLVTGLDQGAMLRLSGDGFGRVPTAGRGVGTEGGAAFAGPDDGWLGGDGGPVRYGRTPEPGRLRTWPVPFRHPLTAVVAAPGAPIGAIDAEALAVGDQGEVARYVPGQGWSPEPLIGATGARATPVLRGVAWPADDRAYAVGNNAEMWLWRKATGLWEPDPAKPPNLATANFTGIAFDPGNPDRGYAIGKQGVLLRYDREWTQDPLPAGLGDANFTSIAFAGHEAIVTYKTPIETTADQGYRGGIIVDDGSGWREDTALAAVLPAPGARGSGGAALGESSVPERVAGLPDGSAVVATLDGHVAERDGAGGAWRASGLQAVGYPVALGAFHEDGTLRAVISVDPTFGSAVLLKTDIDTIINPAPPGQAPVLLDPYPIPSGGYVLRQTAAGWHDEQHVYASRSAPGGSGNYDLPEEPDPVLAFLTDPFGRTGWAVGGDVEVQTANVVRYPDDGQAAPGASAAPVTADPGQATFAIGGGAACLSGCADLQPVGAGPWRWLPAAVARAGQIGGVRAFLDTGPGTAGPEAAADFAHEQAAAAQRLTGAAGALPVFAAASTTDRDAGDSLDTFLSAFGGATAPLGSSPAPGIVPVDAARPDHAYYAFDSTGAAGTVRVVVLDTSGPAVGDDQRCWLASQLSNAAAQATPAIVVGGRAVADLADSDALAATLTTGGAAGCPAAGAPAAASAYFYDAPEINQRVTITSGDAAIPGFGTGSLGYITLPLNLVANTPPNSGFLLAQVDVAHRDETTNVAPVSVRLIPNIAELAVDATDGTLLRRSQVALFDGLARRPRAGQGCRDAPSCQIIPDPYVPIPFACVGDGCDRTLAPEYRFTSSDPSVADFVARDPTSTNPRRVLLDGAGDPVADAASGLLCAYNSGTTTITLTSGGLSYSQKVTVQEGSVRRPCGTVPANRAAAPAPRTGETAVAQPLEQPPLSTTPAGGGGLLPPPPVPAAHHAPAKPHKAKPAPPALEPSIPFLPVASGLTQVVAAPPPPAPTAARPAPPSGSASSQVYQSAVAPERQREEEPSVETAHSMVRYDAATSLPQTLSRGGAVLLLVLAGLALTDLRPRPRRRYAYITTTHDDDRSDPRTPR
jgi:hypothetical protein